MSEVKMPTCFVIMPISDQQGYENGHFKVVYDYLLKPACEAAGFDVKRADEVENTNFIITDILKKIIESDIVLCDLSSKNPNVLYELGLRQAFNKKVMLISDDITDKIFDISGFRIVNYHSSLKPDVINDDKKKIESALKSTYNNNTDINSVIRLLSIEPAIVGEKTEISDQTVLILEAINDLEYNIRTSYLESAFYNKYKTYGLKDLTARSQDMRSIDELLKIEKEEFQKISKIIGNV